jgi:NAD(P)-dependent dehydrogenase (short-subunit alcohol dehydrogenase family)
LAQRGYDIALNYHSKRARAEEVAAAVRDSKRRALIVQADLTLEADVAAMMRTVRGEFQSIDALVLNASGGLEKGKPPDYALRLSLTAQVRVVDFALPLMPQGGRIVFVTSPMAHFYGERRVKGPYEPVAASKYAGEQALLGRRVKAPILLERHHKLRIIFSMLVCSRRHRIPALLYRSRTAIHTGRCITLRRACSTSP